MKKNEKGFSVIHSLLVLVIIGLVGFVGWYVFSRNQKTDSNAAVSNTQKEATTEQEATTEPDKVPSTGSASEGFLVVTLNRDLGFKESKLKFQLSSDIKDAYYVTGKVGTAFSVRSLDNIAGCKADEQTNGAARLGYDIGQGDKSPLRNDANAVRMGQDWVVIMTEFTDTGACASDDPTVQAKIAAVKQAFANASKTITEAK